MGIACRPMLALALAALALTGAVDDPVDGAGTPAQDIVHASTSFDSGAGSWSLTLRMRAPVGAADVARVHGILYREDPARPGVCPSDDSSAELGRLEGDTRPGGAETTLSMTSPAFAGARAVCASASLSKGHPLDVLDRPIILESGFVPPQGDPQDPPLTPAALELVSHVIHRRVRFRSLDPGTAVTVRIARRGRTLARGSGHGKVVRIHRTRAGKLVLAHHRRVRGRLYVNLLHPGAPRFSRTFKVTLAR